MRPKSICAPVSFDGRHNWLVVVTDFCYVHFMLRQGGYLLIDDLELHSVGSVLIKSPVSNWAGLSPTFGSSAKEICFMKIRFRSILDYN